MSIFTFYVMKREWWVVGGVISTALVGGPPSSTQPGCSQLWILICYAKSGRPILIIQYVICIT